MQPLEPFFHQLRHSVRLSARSTSSSIPLDRHERGELAIMGDIEPGEWGTALGNDKLTEAIIERVVRTPRTRRKADTSVPPRPTAGLRLGARPPCGGSRIPSALARPARLAVMAYARLSGVSLGMPGSATRRGLVRITENGNGARGGVRACR